MLQEHQLFAKKSKCSFAAHQLEYLGHIISDKGVATNPEKTKAMVERPTPTNITKLRGFLGLTGHCRKVVKNYGLLAKPLTLLLKNHKSFNWTTHAQEAFEALKKNMSSTPVLVLPDFNKPFIIETDTCASRIGAMLLWEGHPLAYYSKALGQINQKLSIHEKEFRAIMMAIDKWRPLLEQG